MNASRSIPVVLVVAAATLSCARDASEATVETRMHTGESVWAFQPEWSPDGKRLAFAKVVEGRAGIWVENADGTNPVRLTHGVWDNGPFWSPDGRWITYTAESPSFEVMVVPSDGGEPRALTTDPALEYPIGWLPDGSGIVFLRNADLITTHVVMIADGAIRPLVPAEGSVEAQLSPDGTKVAYEIQAADGTLTIWVWDSATNQHRQLTTEGREGLDEGEAWSPDGKSILYRSTRTGMPDLWIADVATGELRQLTTDIQPDFGGRWSPDGQWVAFISGRGGQTDVWVMPASGGDAVRVTNDLAIEVAISWNPDGRRLTYQSDPENTQVRVIATEGGESRLLSFADYAAGNHRISPDGGQVLFESNRSGNNDIWVVPTAGGDPRPLTTTALNDVSARWSPDGKSVVFQSNRSGTNDVFVMADTGGEARPVADGPRGEVGGQFSPDGRTIAFQSSRDAQTTDVWTVPAEGGTPTRLTRLDAFTTLESWSPDGQWLLVNTGQASGAVYRVPVAGGTPERLPLPRGAQTPTWSPDGTRIAYTDLAGGYSYLGVLTIGGEATRLTRIEEAYDLNPAWSPDGTRIAWDSFDLPSSAEDIHVINLSDGAVTKVTSTPGVRELAPRWTPDGRNLVFMYDELTVHIVTATVGPLLDAAAAARR